MSPWFGGQDRSRGEGGIGADGGMIEERQMQTKLASFVGFVRIDIEPVLEPIALRTEQHEGKS